MRCKVLILLWMFLPALVFATSPVYLTGLAIRPGATLTSVMFYLTQKTVGRLSYSPTSSQVMVEFQNTDKKFNLQNARLGGSNVTSIDSKALAGHVLQFILRVNCSVSAKVFYLPPAKDKIGETLQLDVLCLKKEPKQNQLKGKVLVKATEKKSRVFTIVIDAGHGGKDVGASGNHGIKEKDVVLSIAKKLAEEMGHDKNIRVVLTRKGDYFVPLGERLKRARKGNADLFIAIHADAYFDNNATGASVYALSEHGASSVAARWLAQRENHSELGDLALRSLKDQSPVLRSVLIDLAQTMTLRDSIFLGTKILDALEAISSLHYTHVERAPFLVLKSPDIPSILVETGFISNPKEEKRLADPHYQAKIAQALRLGIKQYINKLNESR